MDLWRITKYHPLDGEGGRRYSGRWHTAGVPVVYLAASPPGALIEILVHLDFDEDELPPYKLLRIAVPASVRIPSLKTPVREMWNSNLALTRKLGNNWLKSKRSLLVRVPSAILPHTFNYLLNPMHKDAVKIGIADETPITLDSRLLRKGNL